MGSGENGGIRGGRGVGGIRGGEVEGMEELGEEERYSSIVKGSRGREGRVWRNNSWRDRGRERGRE